MNINYAYKSGRLHGFIQSLPEYEIPGITINDRTAFYKFLEEQIAQIETDSCNYLSSLDNTR
jgi:hypothetical protein